MASEGGDVRPRDGGRGGLMTAEGARIRFYSICLSLQYAIILIVPCIDISNAYFFFDSRYFQCRLEKQSLQFTIKPIAYILHLYKYK